MGVYGLTGYVKHAFIGVFKYWSTSKRKDRQKERLIIDGSGLVHRVFFSTSTPISRLSGGNWRAFKVAFQKEIQALSSAFEVTVVFDGASIHEFKIDTMLSRQAEKILNQDRTIPEMMFYLASDILKELGINYCNSMEEADVEIYRMAVELNAYVLSGDSDFYIFPLPKGFLHFEDLTTSDTTVGCNVVTSDELSKHLGIPKSWLPVMSYFCGNDLSAPKLKQLGGTSHVSDVVKVMKSFGLELSVDDLIRQCCSHYNISMPQCMSVLDLNSSTSIPIPLGVTEKLRCGSLPRNMIDVLVSRKFRCSVQASDMDLMNPWLLYRDVRKFIYKRLMNLCGLKDAENFVVLETLRLKGKITEEAVQAMTEKELATFTKTTLLKLKRMSEEDKSEMKFERAAIDMFLAAIKKTKIEFLPLLNEFMMEREKTRLEKYFGSGKGNPFLCCALQLALLHVRMLNDILTSERFYFIE